VDGIPSQEGILFALLPIFKILIYNKLG
jgi:hypothetical protein